MTAEQRAQITAAVRAIMDTISAAANEAKYEPILAHASAEDGLCVWQAQIYSCKEVQKSYQEAWSSTKPDRLQRQETDGIDIRIQVLSPTVALAATTIKENRAYTADDKVSRASFGSLSVLVLENGTWKSIAGQQANWPIDTTAAR